MINASVYIAWCSFKNRVLVRLRRLREPRYLVGAIVGVAYLYFALFSQGRGPRVSTGRGRRQPANGFPPAFQAAGTSIGGGVLMVFAVLAWLLPSRSGLLDFSQAERAFLFPAPVSRRQLLAHRVIRAQISALIASTFIGLFAAPFSGAGRLRLAVGFWAMMMTMRVYFAAVALTRVRLQSKSASRFVALVPVGALVAGIAVVGTSVVRSLMEPAAGAADVVVRLSRATSTGLPHAVLWPFIAILRPPFLGSPADFFPALGASLAVLASVTAWMLLSDSAFDAVAGEGGEYQAEVVRNTAKPASARTVGWTLPLTGPPELALFWKGVMETIRGVSLKTLRYVLPALFGLMGIAVSIVAANRMRGPAAVASLFASVIGGVAVLFGPQMARLDLRTDFEHLDVLKTWPLRAAEVIRGEMLWPAVLVSTVAVTGILVAAIFSGTALPNTPFVSRWSFALAAVLAAPALIAAQFAVHNTATILFPAWVQIGKQRTRGIDAMGQRLIMLAAIVVSLAAFSLPGAIGGGLVWLVFHRLVGDVVYVPAAAVFAAIVLVEVLAVTELLGPAYERIDVTSVERAE